MSRSIGSDPSSLQMRNAKNTALGKRTQAKLNTKKAHHSAHQVRRQGMARGSWEGLDKGSSAYIQSNNGGYLAHSAQKARGANKPIDFSMAHTKGFSGTIKDRGTIRNMAHLSNKGSTAKMSKLMKLDSFF